MRADCYSVFILCVCGGNEGRLLKLYSSVDTTLLHEVTWCSEQTNSCKTAATHTPRTHARTHGSLYDVLNLVRWDQTEPLAL